MLCHRLLSAPTATNPLGIKGAGDAGAGLAGAEWVTIKGFVHLRRGWFEIISAELRFAREHLARIDNAKRQKFKLKTGSN